MNAWSPNISIQLVMEKLKSLSYLPETTSQNYPELFICVSYSSKPQKRFLIVHINAQVTRSTVTQKIML